MFEITDKANAPLVRWKPTTRTTEPDSGATSKQRPYFANATKCPGAHSSTGPSTSSSKLDFECNVNSYGSSEYFVAIGVFESP